MKRQMPLSTTVLLALTAMGVAHGAPIGGFYWADGATEWNGPVQNYDGEHMTADTTWWLTGKPDSDVNGNGYAWDLEDNDYVGGWRQCSGSGDESVTVHFHLPILDVDGPDFMIHNYAGQNASASVWASSDNVDFVEVGQLGGGTPGYFTDDWIDFDGLVCDVHYVRVMREAVGSKTAAFIDAFGAPLPSVDPGVGVAVGPFPCVDAMPAPPPPPLPIPEPGTVALLGLGSLAFARRRW